MKKNTLNIIFMIVIILLAFSCKKNVILSDEDKSKELNNLINNIDWLKVKNIYGSSTIRIKSDKIIYIDPIDINEESAKIKADYIFITHEHSDHFSFPSILKLKKDSTKVISMPGIIRLFAKTKIKTNSVSPNEIIKIDGMTVEAIPAYNDAHPKTDGGIGFVITLANGIRFYVSGSTDVTPEMNNVKDIDVGIFYVSGGALNGEETVKAIKIIQPKIAIPVHVVDYDMDEIAVIKKNISASTELLVLEKK